MTLSAHEALPILVEIESRAFAFPRGYLAKVIPSPGQIQCVRMKGSKMEIRHNHSFDCSFFEKSVQNKGSLYIRYSHHDWTHNQIQKKTFCLTGPFDSLDMCDLMTCLHERGTYFIPMQLGLPMLQPLKNARKDFLPFHTYDYMTVEPPYVDFSPPRIAWQDIRPHLRHVLEHGFDKEAAQKAFAENLS